METNSLYEGDLDPAFWASFMYDIQGQDNNLSAPTLMPDMLEAQVSEPKPESTANDDITRLVSDILIHPNTNFWQPTNHDLLKAG
jgi:hypothetical protein